MAPVRELLYPVRGEKIVHMRYDIGLRARLRAEVVTRSQVKIQFVTTPSTEIAL